MTVRLSMSSLAGTARTLVAVGTARLASMLSTTRAAGPLRMTVSDVLAGGVAGRDVAPGARWVDGTGAAAGAADGAASGAAAAGASAAGAAGSSRAGAAGASAGREASGE